MREGVSEGGRDWLGAISNNTASVNFCTNLYV